MKAHNFIQWKGTDVCMDFTCSCGNYFHIDEYFVYSVRCLECNKVWKLADTVALTEITDIKDDEYKTAKVGDQGEKA